MHDFALGKCSTDGNVSEVSPPELEKRGEKWRACGDRRTLPRCSGGAKVEPDATWTANA